MAFKDWFRRRSSSPTTATSSTPNPPQTFYTSRLASDRHTASRKLPPGTSEKSLGGVTYWTYSFRCQLGREYRLTAYFDGQEYQVKVLEPILLKRYNIHDAHVFPDGRICLNPPANGGASLEEAYAKSVIWATGFSIFEQIGKFPFSGNNE